MSRSVRARASLPVPTHTRGRTGLRDPTGEPRPVGRRPADPRRTRRHGGRALGGQVRAHDAVEPEPPDVEAQSAPGDQVPDVTGAGQEDRLDPPTADRPVRSRVLDRQHLRPVQRHLDRPQHRRRRDECGRRAGPDARGECIGAAARVGRQRVEHLGARGLGIGSERAARRERTDRERERDGLRGREVDGWQGDGRRKHVPPADARLRHDREARLLQSRHVTLHRARRHLEESRQTHARRAGGSDAAELLSQRVQPVRPVHPTPVVMVVVPW